MIYKPLKCRSIHFFLQGDSFTIPSLSKSDNKKTVSCQALTPYTKINSDAGRSDLRNVTVLCKFMCHPVLSKRASKTFDLYD